MFVINEHGSAAHNLMPSDPERGERIARWLTQWDGLSLAEADLVTQLGIRPSTSPATGLLAVWPVGALTAAVRTGRRSPTSCSTRAPARL